MQINSVLAGYADATSAGRRAETAQRSADRPAEASVSRGPTEAEALRTIMADYDLTRMTPERFSEMLDRLRNASVLSDEEFTQLAQIRLELDREGIDSDDPVDLVDFYAQRLQRLSRQLGDPSSGSSGRAVLRESLAETSRRLDWLQKLALVHDAPESVGLDALA